MGKPVYTSDEDFGFVTKLFLIMYLLVRLTVLLCLLPFAFVYHKTCNVVSNGFGWSTTEP